MASTWMVVILLVLAALLGWPTPSSAYGSAMENAKERTNLAAEEARLKAEETMQGAKEAGESWTDWARDRLSEGLGMRYDKSKVDAQEMMDMTGDIAMKTKDKMSDFASEAAEVASEKAGEAKDVVMSGAGEAKESLKKARDATGKMMGDCGDHAADTAERTYEGAKQRLGEAYQNAKDAVTGNAKANYEAAKEKASQAAGDVGTKMEEL